LRPIVVWKGDHCTMNISGNILGYWLGFSLTWKVVIVSQLIFWRMQFIGHGIPESPTLLDKLVEAFMINPIFFLLEFLQKYYGCEPYPNF